MTFSSCKSGSSCTEQRTVLLQHSARDEVCCLNYLELTGSLYLKWVWFIPVLIVSWYKKRQMRLFSFSKKVLNLQKTVIMQKHPMCWMQDGMEQTNACNPKSWAVICSTESNPSWCDKNFPRAHSAEQLQLHLFPGRIKGRRASDPLLVLNLWMSLQKLQRKVSWRDEVHRTFVDLRFLCPGFHLVALVLAHFYIHPLYLHSCNSSHCSENQAQQNGPKKVCPETPNCFRTLKRGSSRCWCSTSPSVKGEFLSQEILQANRDAYSTAYINSATGKILLLVPYMIQHWGKWATWCKFFQRSWQWVLRKPRAELLVSIRAEGIILGENDILNQPGSGGKWSFLKPGK